MFKVLRLDIEPKDYPLSDDSNTVEFITHSGREQLVTTGVSIDPRDEIGHEHIVYDVYTVLNRKIMIKPEQKILLEQIIQNSVNDYVNKSEAFKGLSQEEIIQDVLNVTFGGKTSLHPLQTPKTSTPTLLSRLISFFYEPRL